MPVTMSTSLMSYRASPSGLRSVAPAAGWNSDRPRQQRAPNALNAGSQSFTNRPSPASEQLHPSSFMFVVASSSALSPDNVVPEINLAPLSAVLSPPSQPSAESPMSVVPELILAAIPKKPPETSPQPSVVPAIDLAPLAEKRPEASPPQPSVVPEINLAPLAGKPPEASPPAQPSVVPEINLAPLADHPAEASFPTPCVVPEIDLAPLGRLTDDGRMVDEPPEDSESAHVYMSLVVV